MSCLAKTVAAALAVFAAGLGGCTGGDPHERAVEELGGRMDRIAEVISSVTDVDSAERALAEIRKIVEEMKGIAVEAGELGGPEPGTRPALASRMKANAAELERAMAGSRVTMQKAGPQATMIMVRGLMELAPAMDGITSLYEEPAAPARPPGK